MKANEALEKVLNNLIAEGKSKHTIKAYRKAARNLILHTQKENIEDINDQDLRDFVVYLTNQGWKENAINKVVSHIKGTWKALELFEMIPKNPMKKFRRKFAKKTVITENEWLTFDETEKMKQNLPNTKAKATFIVGVRTGVRAETLTNPQRKKPIIDLENKKMIVTEKYDKTRIVYFNDEVKEALKSLFDAGYGFPCLHRNTFNKILQETAKKIGLNKPVTCLTLRHTFACQSRLKGIDIVDLRDLMGHEDISMTLIYAAVGATEIEKSYRRIWG